MSLPEIKDKIFQNSDENFHVIEILDAILENALFEGASDIHIEPMEKEIFVRYRIDGILEKEITLPKKLLPELVERIKILSKLDLDERQKPQNGRFDFKTKNFNAFVQSSIMPVFYGDKIVLRIFNEANNTTSQKQLGFGKTEMEIINRNIKKTNGMILVAGRADSGKTTTLYTILNLLNSSEKNICTIEDLIEYRIPGVNQSQINLDANFDYANGLRSFLRQDPDIIMLGEIIDSNTAEISVHAATTGHLILSTLPSKNSEDAISRMLDFGVPSFLLSSALKMIISQKLCRKICDDCKESYKLDSKTWSELKELFDVEQITEKLKDNNVLKSGDTLESISYYRGKGCKKCGGDGFRGRVGIYEILEITDEICDLISQNQISLILQKASESKNFLTLAEDGFIKALKGITTIDEIFNIAKE